VSMVLMVVGSRTRVTEVEIGEKMSWRTRPLTLGEISLCYIWIWWVSFSFLSRFVCFCVVCIRLVCWFQT
jgi:hypothetical protein